MACFFLYFISLFKYDLNTYLCASFWRLLWFEYEMCPIGSCVECLNSATQLVALFWEVLETLGGGV
jgi:hypothetical protein